MSQLKANSITHSENADYHMAVIGDDSIGYYNMVCTQKAFQSLHSSPAKTNYGEIQSVKVIYDFRADSMYYINLKQYPSHYLFAKEFLNYKKRDVDFLYSQYTSCPSRYLNLITINYHKNIDKYVFEFFAYDRVDCEGIKNTYQKLLETSFFGDKLYFNANNLEWKLCEDFPIIDANELYNGQNYQALNLEESYGFLRAIDINVLSFEQPGRHDIVLLYGIPNDLSVVSGIITTEFKTPLSHINMLSHSWKTPNVALKDAAGNSSIQDLMGEEYRLLLMWMLD